MAIRGFGFARHGRGPGFATPWDDFRRWRTHGPPFWMPTHRFERPPYVWTPPYRPGPDRGMWLREKFYERRDVGPAYQRNTAADYRQQADNALANVNVRFENAKKIEAPVRPKGQSTPYSEEITSPAYFSNEKWQKVLAGHGVVINANAQKKEDRLLLMVDGVRVNLSYALSDEQLKKLTAEHLEGRDGVTVEERLKIINEVIKDDFQQEITIKHLESSDYINIKMKEEKQKAAEAEVFAEQDRRERLERAQREETERQQKENNRIRFDKQAVNGRELGLFMPGMMFRSPAAHGREVIVGEIRVDRTPDGRYLISAYINGDRVMREISAKQAQQFMEANDKSRYRLFADIYRDKVEIARGQQTTIDNKVYEMPDGGLMTSEQVAIANAKSDITDGRNLQRLNERKAFYREGTGRQQEVDVQRIQAERDQVSGKYRLTAVVDGNAVSYEITAKQFEKFQSMDDMHRMKLLAKVAPDIELRTRPGMGFNPLAFMAATAVAGLEVAAGISMMQHRPRPAIFVEGHPGPPNDIPVYSKPGVIPPEAVAGRIFEQQMEQAERSAGEGMGRRL